MLSARRASLCFLAAVSFGSFSLVALPACADQVLVDIGSGFDLNTVALHDAEVRLNGNALRVDAGHSEKQPGIVLKSPAGCWNLLKWQEVTADVTNVGDQPLAIQCRAASSSTEQSEKGIVGRIALAPGEKKTIHLTLGRLLARELRNKLVGVRGMPAQAWNPNIDPSNVTELTFFVDAPTADSRFEVSDIQAREVPEQVAAATEKDFFPMIDTYGQYIHKDWPRKTNSAADMALRKQEEEADLAAHPGFADRDQYGGWATGPQLKATGFFRVEKHQGKWWFVDPEGHLFWSFGTNGVSTDSSETPITDRQHWFADLPARDGPMAQFYRGKAPLKPYRIDPAAPSFLYFKGKDLDGVEKVNEDFDFSGLNLLRKYGDGWKNTFYELTCRRMRSWGLNTIALGSKGDVIRMHKVPYVERCSVSCRQLEGKAGYWKTFPDVFNPAFASKTRERLAQLKETAGNDPWCLGVFLHNEICWGNDSVALSVVTLASPADQTAKQVFVDDLRKKYQTIDKLNAVWDTEHASWDALLQSTTPPDKAKAREDLEVFFVKTADRYYKIISDAMKEYTPNLLNLGCRFASWGQGEAATRVAAKYCDVLSFNLYAHHCVIPRFPEDVDKPIIIGEFHFGALDRGMFYTALAGSADQKDRAAAMKHYAEDALDDPRMVGVHWFEFRDQAPTARGDGENFQFGFFDLCDTPYPEFIQAAREVGAEMYQRRSGKQE